MADESDAGNGTGHSGPNNSTRRYVDIVALVLGVVSGIGGLLGISEGTGRLWLSLVGVAFLLVALVRLTHHYFVSVNRQLNERLTAQAGALEAARQEFEAARCEDRAQHQRYLDALLRTIDRESPLFEDHLVITVKIGSDDAGDEVTEAWHTTPKPRLTHRAIRPIVPTDDDRVTTLADIGFTCTVVNSSDQITPLPLVERSRYLRAWLVFEPAHTDPVDWRVTYRPHGLWSPLREKGRDLLSWVDRLPTFNGASSSLVDFEVRFLFPPSPLAPKVRERREYGSADAPVQNADQSWSIVWRDPRPAGRRYEWELLTRRS